MLPLQTSASFFFVFPGFTNLTRVQSLLLYSSSLQFAANANFHLPFIPKSLFSKAFLDNFFFFLGGVMIIANAQITTKQPDMVHAVSGPFVTQCDVP